MYRRCYRAVLSELNAKELFLAPFATFNIGGTANVVLPKDEKSLINSVKLLERYDLPYKVIGAGSNLLISSKRHRRIFVCLRELKSEIIISDNRVYASAGVRLSELIAKCKEAGLSGLEKLYGIPASLGGAIAMNASAFGCMIFQHLSEIKLLENGKVKLACAQSIKRGYHESELLGSKKIILGASFVLEKTSSEEISKTIKEVTLSRLEKQPKGNSAGSVFKNPEGCSAGKLIDEAGLKGLQVGGAYVSEKHANFIISEDATSGDVLKLIKKIKRRIYRKYKIRLKEEIEYIGD